MSRLLRNPYLYVLGVPLVAFVGLILAGVDPDHISLSARVFFFAMLAYVGARYMGRAPFLIWQGNTKPESINVIGFAILFVATALTQIYALLVITYDRAPWIVATYWSGGFVVLASVGITMVAYSIPRIPLPPLSGRDGMGMLGSFLFAILSAGALFMAHNFPSIWKIVSAFFAGLMHAA